MKTKNLILSVMAILLITSVSAQKVQIYSPEADAKAEIAAAVKKAQTKGRHVFLQIGGNWCPWCIKFHNFVDADQEIKSYVEENFVVLKINYSPENKNLDVLADLGYPQRFGFPVFVVLDGNGKRIHTQNSAFLEEDKSYNKKRVLQFYKNWSPAAVDPESYK